MQQELELDLRSFRHSEVDAAPLARGVMRLLRNMGYGALAEFCLSSGRRVDVFALNRRGRVIVAEVKSSVADFRADDKWQHYVRFCDQFFFAVAESFPSDILPVDAGLIIADRFGEEIARDAPVNPMAAGLRQKETRRFALYAASRLNRVQDPDF